MLRWKYNDKNFQVVFITPMKDKIKNVKKIEYLLALITRFTL